MYTVLCHPSVCRYAGDTDPAHRIRGSFDPLYFPSLHAIWANFTAEALSLDFGNVAVVRYEDLLWDTPATIRRIGDYIANFNGVPVPAGTIQDSDKIAQGWGFARRHSVAKKFDGCYFLRSESPEFAHQSPLLSELGYKYDY